MHQYHAHANSPIKRSVPSQPAEVHPQPPVVDHFYGSRAKVEVSYGSTAPFTPVDGSQLALRHNGTPSPMSLSPRSPSTPPKKETEEIQGPSHQYSLERQPATYSPSFSQTGNSEQFQRFEPAGPTFGVLDRFISKTEQEKPTGIPSYQYSRPKETLIDYGKDSYSVARENSPESKPRIVVLNSTSGESSPLPRKSSLLEQFTKESSVDKKPSPPTRLLPEVPQLPAISKLPDSYVSNSGGKFDSIAEVDQNAKEYHSPRFIPENPEYFSFSPQNDKWANGSTPSPSHFQESKALFFSSQVESEAESEKRKDKARSALQSLEYSELREKLVEEQHKNLMLQQKVDRLEKELMTGGQPSPGDRSRSTDLMLQQEKAKMAEQLRQVKQQSQVITDQAEQYKQIADGYISQLEAKNDHQVKELKKQEDIIRDLRSKLQSSNYSSSFQKTASSTLTSSDATLGKILQVFREFFGELDTTLRSSHGTFYSPNVVSHINSQLEHLSTRPLESLARDEPLHELGNLKVLLSSLNKVIATRTVPLPAGAVKKGVESEYQRAETDRGPQREDSPSGRYSTKSLYREKKDDSGTYKLVEENQKLAVEYSKLKMQNKSLKEHLHELMSDKSGYHAGYSLAS